MLNARLPDCAGADANKSALYSLSSIADESHCTTGLNLLVELFHKKPILMYQIDGATLCTLLPESAGVDANTSVFLYLIAFREGQRLLKDLFQCNPRLMSEISAEALYARTPESEDLETNTSTLYWASSDRGGLDVLKQLYMGNPALMKQMSAETLCARRPKVAKDGFNESVLLLWASSEVGRDLLRQLFIENQTLPQQISKEGDFTIGERLSTTRLGKDFICQLNSEVNIAQNTGLLFLTTGTAHLDQIHPSESESLQPPLQQHRQG